MEEPFKPVPKTRRRDPSTADGWRAWAAQHRADADRTRATMLREAADAEAMATRWTCTACAQLVLVPISKAGVRQFSKSYGQHELGCPRSLGVAL